MDNKDKQNQVSLPGAGGTEPTILEVLNRSITSDCDNEETADLQHSQPQLVDVGSDDSAEDINDTSLLDVGYVAQVTDLDVDDNQLENSDVADFESCLITEISRASESGESVAELIPEPETQFERLPTIRETESDKCDKSSKSSENIHALEEERLPATDSFQRSTHQEEDKQAVGFDENNQQPEAIHLPEFIADGEKLFKFQYEHLDPEDQKIILEAIGSNLQQNATLHNEDELDPEPESTINQECLLKDNSPLTSPLILLSNPILNEQRSSDCGTEPDRNTSPSHPTSFDHIEDHNTISENYLDTEEEVLTSPNTTFQEAREIQAETANTKYSSPDVDPESSYIVNSPLLETNDPQLKIPEKYPPEVPHPINQNSDNESQSVLDSDEFDLSTEAKREYYQHLREYLDNEDLNRPPVPLQTYRWEDVRRAKQQGGYPWTHLYKRPLGPGEQPQIATLRLSQERQKFSSESPRSSKKVRIHDEVLVKETERYICDLSDNETDNDDDDEDEEEDSIEDQQENTKDLLHPGREDQQRQIEPEDSHSIQSEPISISASASDTDGKSSKISRLKGILKRRLSAKQTKPDSSPESQASENKSTSNKKKIEDSPKKAKYCRPIMDKLKSMADRKLKKRNIKKVPLRDNEKIILSEKQKILKLKSSPKADHGAIPHFIEKQDSDDILEILELEESPSKTRKRRDHEGAGETSILIPDEIIELPTSAAPQSEEEEEAVEPTAPADEIQTDLDSQVDEPTVSEILEEELRLLLKPKKAPRRRKEHIYEDIDDEDIEARIDEILQEAVESAIKISLQIQEEKLRGSPDEERIRTSYYPDEETFDVLKIVEDHDAEELLEAKEPELKSAMRREPSPSSDKKVTFSHVEDEAEPHREDIVLPEEYRTSSRWSNTGDHEYEPIGQPLDESHRMDMQKEASPIPTLQISEPMETEAAEIADAASLTSFERKEREEEEHEASAYEQQRDIEERYFSSIPTTPRADSRTDNEIHTSQVDSSALEELPLKAENRKKSFMASAQDRSRKMQQNIRSQAGKIRTKIRGPKKPVTGSPKTKERRRFKGPDFSKIKMPEMKRPELPKFKTPDMPKFKAPEFKRPEFTKFDKPIFTKPDMSKFKIPDTMTLKLRRTRSLKETEVTTASSTTPETAPTTKKKFEFSFGTYPRMLRKRKQKFSTVVVARADDVPSTETPPSVESATLPRQEKGPVSSRWADKFSDVSYADSESGKYQRYGSEPESLGRESSLERRMKEDLERTAREEEELEIIHSVEQKQFADYDEENRAIHEISKTREGEFRKRRPMVHQDSDLVSEESKEVGWSEKDIIRNTILRRDEAEMEHLQEPEKYQSEEGLGGSNTNTNQETQSTGSSGILRQKGVIEEIDDDEFFLRKRGISQDNIEIRQYISSAIREGLGTPVNALAQLGSAQDYYPDMDVSNEQVDYGYDVPPPKPRRANKHFNNFDRDRDTESRDVSQDFEIERRGSFDDNISLPHAGNDYFRNIAPSRPLRKARKQYSHDSQEDHEVPSEDIPFLDEDDDKAFFKKMNIQRYAQHQREDPDDVVEEMKPVPPPKAPKRRKKQQRESVEKDSYANRFSGRSVSNSFLPSEERDEDFIVYRTQHEYIIPLASGETFNAPAPMPRRSRSRSQSRNTDDDRTSRGADSFASESFPIAVEKFHIDMKDNDGYATVRKEPPPRPPAPNRRKRSSSPQVDQHFSTMPHLKRESSGPSRPIRNYSTVGPSRPPRRKSSSASNGEAQKNISSPDVTQYEELDLDEEDEDRVESPRDLHSGDVINKMKYRPLPPPPRPPRDGRKLNRDPRDSSDDKDDKDGGMEKIVCDIQRNGNYDVEKLTEKCIEVEVSTQTDPLPDDFCCEEFEITDDMRIIEPRCSKTLQDILKEEQEAEIERARQLADEDSLTRGLQRFREAGQRSFSERSKGSTADRSKASISRPTTPSALVLERRIPTPIPNSRGETMIEASLIVLPVDDNDLEDENLEQLEHQQSSLEKEDTIEDDAIKSESGETNQEEEQRLTTDQSDDQETRHSYEYESSLDREEEEIVETEEEPPPLPPPRKRSSIPVESSSLDEPESAEETALLPTTLEDPHEELQVEPVTTLPSRLTIADLEVERLSVNALQAGRIMVSELHGSSITTDELECKSGNIVARNLQFPPGFIEEIIERVRSSERSHSQAETQTTEPLESQSQPTSEEKPPVNITSPQQQQQPPIVPSEYMQYSIPPQLFYNLRNPSEEELHHSPTHRRRRHHRRRSSTSEDEAHREHRRSRHGTRSPEPSIGQLGGQLLNACGTSIVRTMHQIANILRANEKEGNERNISTAIVIVILMTIGFLLLGMAGNKNIHHHHWDYFNPPGNQGS